jgi:hypothetical protein
VWTPGRRHGIEDVALEAERATAPLFGGPPIDTVLEHGDGSSRVDVDDLVDPGDLQCRVIDHLGQPLRVSGAMILPRESSVGFPVV